MTSPRVRDLVRLRAWAAGWRSRGCAERAAVIAVAVYAFIVGVWPQPLAHWPFESHFFYHNKHLLPPQPLVRALLPLGSLALLLGAILRLRRSRFLPLALFGCGIALQWSFAGLETGFNATRLSATLIHPHMGHSEFVLLSGEEQHPLQLVREYETRSATDTRYVFAQTKPPGQMLFYALWSKAFRTLRLEAAFERVAQDIEALPRPPVTAYAAFLTLGFLVFSMLPVFVVHRLGERLGGRPLGLSATLAFLLCPAIQLVTMHLDQVLYPLLAALTLYLGWLAIDRDRHFALAAGFALYACLYVSFSMLVLFPTMLLGAASVYLLRPALRRRTLAAALLGAAGCAVGYLVARFGLDFQLLVADRRIMAHHAAWRHVTGLVTAPVTVQNLVEFARWLGLPAAMACICQWVRIARRLGRWRELEPIELVAFVYPVLLVAVSTFGHAIAEVGRLWIPLMVPPFFFVAWELARSRKPGPPLVFVATSFVMIWLAKSYHDFQ